MHALNEYAIKASVHFGYDSLKMKLVNFRKLMFSGLAWPGPGSFQYTISCTHTKYDKQTQKKIHKNNSTCLQYAINIALNLYGHIYVREIVIDLCMCVRYRVHRI